MERTRQELLEQAESMHAIISAESQAEHVPEVLGKLTERIAFLRSQVDLQVVLGIYGTLDTCEVPQDSMIRRLCGKTLLAKLVRAAEQIPEPTT